jgi:hypothetical protein
VLESRLREAERELREIKQHLVRESFPSAKHPSAN